MEVGAACTGASIKLRLAELSGIRTTVYCSSVALGEVGRRRIGESFHHFYLGGELIVIFDNRLNASGFGQFRALF
jgi:hypothetical protein